MEKITYFGLSRPSSCFDMFLAKRVLYNMPKPYYIMKKLHVSAYSGHLQVLTAFLLKEFYIICINHII